MIGHHVHLARVWIVSMNLRCLALLALLAMPLTTWAQNAQSVDSGLQPLYTRLEEVRKEQLALTDTIQSSKADPQQKAQATSEYQKLEAEKIRIQREIARVRMMDKSAL